MDAQILLHMASIALFAFLRPGTFQGGPVRSIAPGQEVLGELSKELTGAGFHLSVDEAGLLTVEAGSFDMDVDLRITTLAGDIVAEAERGGVGTDARLVLAVEKGTYCLTVTSRGRCTGSFSLSARRGALDPPSRPDHLKAELDYWDRALSSPCSDEARSAMGLRMAALSAFELGLHQAAIERFEALLELATETKEKSSALLAQAHIGASQVALGRIEEAIASLGRAREMEKGVEANPPALQAMVHRALAEALLAKNELDAASMQYEALSSLAAQSFMPFEEIYSICGLAQVEARRSNLERAGSLFEQACERGAMLGGPFHAAAVLQRANFLISKGDLNLARQSLTQAVTLGIPSVARADLQGTLGRVEEESGHLAVARVHYLEVLETCNSIGYERGAALALLRLAHVAWRLADLETAQEFLEQARSKVIGTELEIELWDETAFLRGASGDRAGRIQALERALSLAEKTGLVDAALRLRINLSEAHQEAGALDAARTLAEAAIEQAEVEHRDELAACAAINLAYVDLLSSQPEVARSRAQEALSTLRRLGRLEFQLAPLETIARASILLDDTQEAWRAIQDAWTVLENLANAGLSVEENSQLRSRHSWWAETLVQDLLEKELSQLDPDSPAFTELIERGLAEASRWKGRALLETLSVAGDATASLRPSDLRVNLVRPGTTLIEYALGSEKLFAYGMDSEKLVFVALGARESLEISTRRFAALISSPGPLSPVAELGADLYDRLVDPVLRALDASPQTLVIVPTAELLLVPFEALVVATTGADRSDPAEIVFLLDRCTIAYGPSTAVLAKLAGSLPIPRGRTLLVADPVYPSECGSESAKDRPPEPFNFVRIPGTRDEVAEAAQLLARQGTSDSAASELRNILQSRSGYLEADAFALCLGKDASAERLVSEVKSCSILHLGVHGFVSGTDPLLCGIALSSGKLGTGFMSTRDIMGLALNLEIAVLPACDTARGQIRGGEGMLSIARAFLHAGARSVVASLWQVKDRETADLIRSFYEAWLSRGLHPAEALREAKLSLRKGQRSSDVSTGELARGKPAASAKLSTDRGHPYVWAPCVYVGAPK